MKVILDIPDDKLEELLKILDKVPYVSYEMVGDHVAEDAVAYRTEIPESQKEMIRKRFEEAGPEDYQDWNEAKKRLDDKYGVRVNDDERPLGLQFLQDKNCLSDSPLPFR